MMVNPLELNTIMTDEEMAAIKKYIQHYLKVEGAKMALAGAKEQLGLAAKLLSDACFATDDNDQPAGAIPDRFVVHYQGWLYLVEIDEEDGKHHLVTPISGILK